MMGNKDIPSVANLMERFIIKDPFDRDWLMSLPKEALVEVIIKLHNKDKKTPTSREDE